MSIDERFSEYAESRDDDLRNELVEDHLDLARRLARRFARRGEPVEDLEQVASIALVHAVERFDPSRGAPFTSFAIPTILGEIKRHFRDKGWSVRVPRRVQELYLRVNEAVPSLAQDLGRSPTVSEIAEHLGSDVEEIIEVTETGRSAYRGISLDAPAGESEDRPQADHLGEDDEDLLRAEDRTALRALLERLPDREQRILYLRFFEEKTQAEIAERVGVSQMHVSRLIRKGLAELRASVEGEGAS